MTLSGIIQCSTCDHKLKLKYQVGYIFPVTVKIACEKCGKLIKGTIRHDEVLFDFPNDKVFREHEETSQVVSISSELPIVLGLTNNAPISLTPYIAIGTVIDPLLVSKFENNLKKFIILYDSKFLILQTCNELFENKKWDYFLLETKKNFRPGISLEISSFSECATVLKEVYKDFFKFLATEYYEANFNLKLQNETLNKVSSMENELKKLKELLYTYINIENEFIKGVKLVQKFLENIKSFFPVIILSYNNDFSKQYTDKIGLTTFEFLDLKEMYIEQFEYLSRISSVYFGLLNLAENHNYDNFGAIKDCDKLSSYFTKDNGIKKDIVKKSKLLDEYYLNTLNSQLRNGIGHLKTIYEPRTQLIKYYPYKDPSKMDNYKEIYLVDFAVLVYEQALKVKDSLEMLSKFLNITK